MSLNVRLLSAFFSIYVVWGVDLSGDPVGRRDDPSAGDGWRSSLHCRSDAVCLVARVAGTRHLDRMARQHRRWGCCSS